MPTNNCNNDILILTTHDDLLNLSQCATIYIDGTFKTCPRLYTQLFTVHGLYFGAVVPFVYVLLADKRADTYYKVINIVWDAIAGLGSVFDPKIIMSDFESGFIEAVRKQFPTANHKGCFFHYAQAVWKKVQDLGLVISFRDDDEIKDLVHSCFAFAFLPESEIVRVFNEIVNKLSPCKLALLNAFLNYYRTTWLDGLFPLRMWNKCGQDHLHRTNNAVESRHAGLRHNLPCHPNIFVFIREIKRRQSLAQLAVLRANNGEDRSRRKLKYVKLENQLAKMHAAHVMHEITTEQLLSRARHCCKKFR